jgi:uncharacterized repeat protein (TIGR01451 family)
MITPFVYSSGLNQSNTKTEILSSSNYTENLSLYLTSSETFWKVHLTGGSINVSSVTVPSSVSSYSITLTHYTTWQSSYEIFTQYGFGFLGGSEPYPDGALLVVNASSSSDASSLANSLSERFALAFVETGSTSTSYTFFSPINFDTEFQVYFYGLVPQSAGGFASMFTQSQFETNVLDYYQLSYSSSTYSLTMGGLSTLLSESFHLYTQLGLSQNKYNYSSAATSSTIDIYLLGGLVNSSSVPFTNHITNISSTIEIAKSTNNTVPNVAATLDFSFPAILAHRQITPTLTPSSGSSVTVTITVTNVGATGLSSLAPGGATADNVYVNDTWIYGQSSNFRLTQTQTSNNETLAPGASYSVIYAFTVTATSGTYAIPATPVTYEYTSPNNTEAKGETLLNPETIVVAGANTPELEATASIVGGSLQSGQPFSVNVTIVNKGSGAAFSLTSDGLSKQNLPVGSSWSYVSNQSSNSLTQINSSLSYEVSWQDASGVSHSTSTNTVSTVWGFASPWSPALVLTKTVGALVHDQVNVTLNVYNASPNTLSDITIIDSIPAEMTFVRSYNSSVQSSGASVNSNLTSITTEGAVNYIYTLNVTNPADNYIFLPASVSTSWEGQVITHYSGGYGLPLGVVATKIFTPNDGFQGSNVSISIGLVNQGTLPIYHVELNNSYDSFLSIISSNSGYAPILNGEGHLNALLNANLTGTPGVYNSSASAASFIFAGANRTATSSVVKVTIFHLPVVNLTYTASKVEEGHNIIITFTITNPSNVTISNVSYTLTLPKGLRIVSGGPVSFIIPTLGPNSISVHNVTVVTSQPDLYTINGGRLTFGYQGHQLNGISASLNLNINDDIPLRYGIPIVVGLVVVVSTIVYVRKLTTVSTVSKK